MNIQAYKQIAQKIQESSIFNIIINDKTYDSDYTYKLLNDIEIEKKIKETEIKILLNK